MIINKTFTQIYVSTDMEGRYYKWIDTNKTYEEAVNSIGNFIDRVRLVEKTFDSDTFKIAEKVLKETKKS